MSKSFPSFVVTEYTVVDIKLYEVRNMHEKRFAKKWIFIIHAVIVGVCF